ncbi:hypothetical protein BLNAU_21498 [Blattamonas nauphoetae]|uniref:Uncharacterized protein n=1 Tax=Blattamonas nauphoetae TaxID=2049346 RepID=A0ABQ9WVP5_9EUKA|nr:hypothetical protein BLNAU_21498 [Blattamonas nauphoetae]
MPPMRITRFLEHLESPQNESEQEQLLDSPPIVLRHHRRAACDISKLQDQPSSQSTIYQTMNLDTILVALKEEQRTDIPDLLVALHRMTDTDANRRRLVQHNTIPLLSQLLMSSQDERVIYLLLWILSDIGVISTPYEVHHSFDDNVLQAILGFAQSSSLSVIEVAWRFLDNFTIIDHDQKEFVDKLVRLGILEVFTPAMIQLNRSLIQQPAWHLRSLDLIADTPISQFPLTTMSIPGHQNSFHRILRTFRRLSTITQTRITADVATFIFVVFVSGCSPGIDSAVDLLFSDQGLLQDLSSVIYQTQMPQFFPPHIQSFPQLAVSLLSYACEGLSSGYCAYTVLNEVQTRHLRSVSQKKAPTTQSSSGEPDEESLKKQIVTELNNYFHIARNVLHVIGAAIPGGAGVADLYLNADLARFLGECIRVVQAIQHDELSWNSSLLTKTMAEVTEGNPGDLWKRTLKIITLLDCTSLASEEKQQTSTSFLRPQYHVQMKISNIYPEHMKSIHRNIALCLSNVSGITESHSLRILNETIPGPDSPQKFLRFVSDRLVDDTSSSFCADLSIVHGLLLRRSARVYTEIEKSQVLAAIFAFKWYRRTHSIADTSLCIFFEILILFILNASAPNVIFDYVKDDVIERKLLKSTKEFSDKTMETKERFYQHLATLRQAVEQTEIPNVHRSKNRF